jgi:tRNA(Glu) U13 pseudouridine synthase TruD
MKDRSAVTRQLVSIHLPGSERPKEKKNKKRKKD